MGSDPPYRETPKDPVIRVRDVTKSYGSGSAKTQVLRGVDLDVQPGELLALVGQSGSGKSTLLNIIGGLDKPDAGEVEVLGLDTIKTSESKRAKLRNQSIGFVFQAFNLLDHLDVLGNVTIPASFAHQTKKDIKERGREALRRVGLADFSHRRPGELSGGQKQRVAIARALFGAPTLLLCDEPTGNLDSETGREVIEFFRELNAKDGVTLVIVTHERRVSSVAKRVIAMRDGMIVETSDAEVHAEGAGPA
ncbi:MAG: ABC transporter ATP-binding protein [Deltaproteobacteria bacterium]|nr:ABC transporter ATP-binding protein [Deltaproteobacteria bacterium]